MVWRNSGSIHRDRGTIFESQKWTCRRLGMALLRSSLFADEANRPTASRKVTLRRRRFGAFRALRRRAE
jgi:hypothetical protein